MNIHKIVWFFWQIKSCIMELYYNFSLDFLADLIHPKKKVTIKYQPETKSNEFITTIKSSVKLKASHLFCINFIQKCNLQKSITYVSSVVTLLPHFLSLYRLLYQGFFWQSYFTGFKNQLIFFSWFKSLWIAPSTKYLSNGIKVRKKVDRGLNPSVKK